jgi:DNA-binding protein
MNYVLAIVAVFAAGPEVIIRARGNAISQAVTVAEIVRNKFVKDVKVKNVAISTDRVTNESGRPMNVSAIEIVLTK